MQYYNEMLQQNIDPASLSDSSQSTSNANIFFSFADPVTVDNNFYLSQGNRANNHQPAYVS